MVRGRSNKILRLRIIVRTLCKCGKLQIIVQIMIVQIILQTLCTGDVVDRK